MQVEYNRAWFISLRREERGMRIRLKVDPVVGDSFPWEHGGPLIRLGRDPQCELALHCSDNGSVVSWRHAEIRWNSHQVWLADSQSTNGTFLNDQRVQDPAPLATGDRINLGHRGPELLVEALEPDASTNARQSSLPECVVLGETATLASFQRRIAARPATLTALVAAGIAAPVLLVAALVWPSRVPSHSVDARRGRDASVSQLAAGAETVLQTHCHRCHGEAGSNEGGFNSVVNRARLVAREYVVPGNAAESLLFQRLRKGEMPPGGEQPRPQDAEIGLIEAWIAAGAPDFQPQAVTAFIAQDEVLQAIASDLRQSPARDRKYLRYFTITHLSNAGAGGDELQTYRNALSKLVNSLSWLREIKPPTAIGPAETILRIDLRDYRWSEQTWERVAAVDPYALVYDSPAAREIYATAQTPVPWVRGDWFVFKASQPPLYEQVLELPQTDAALEKLLFIDVKQNIQTDKARRAGFNQSGVSQNNRLIERHDSPHGAYWKSYDFSANVNGQNLFQHPLGPSAVLAKARAAEAFQAAGGEIIFNLPNGLQAYMLVDGVGQRIDKGPTAIVSDPNQPDRAVVNGISCMSCHYAGIIPKSDEIRNHVLKNRDLFAAADDILALYPPPAEMEKLMQADAERFRLAVEATGSLVSRKGEPVVNMAKRFNEDLDATLAAAELGLTGAQFTAALKANATLRQLYGQLLVPGVTIKRETFAAAFPEAAQALRLGRPTTRSGK